MHVNGRKEGVLQWATGHRKWIWVVAVMLYILWFGSFLDRMKGTSVLDVQVVATIDVGNKELKEHEPTAIAKEELEEEDDEEDDDVHLEMEKHGICDETPTFLSNAKRAVLLASYPGSGNTWIRHVIQEGTRICTGSMYHDESLIPQFPGEGVRDGSVSVVKTHFPCRNCWFNKKKNKIVPVKWTGDLPKAVGTLYLIRSPFDSILAEFNRAQAANHTGTVDAAVFQTNVWDAFVQQHTQAWVENVKFYLRNHKGGRIYSDARQRPVVLLYFENFVHQFMSEAQILFDKLKSMRRDASLPDTEHSISCVASNSEGSFHRKASKRFNPFTPEQRAAICQATASVWHEDIWGPCNGLLQWERSF